MRQWSHNICICCVRALTWLRLILDNVFGIDFSHSTEPYHLVEPRSCKSHKMLQQIRHLYCRWEQVIRAYKVRIKCIPKWNQKRIIIILYVTEWCIKIDPFFVFCAVCFVFYGSFPKSHNIYSDNVNKGHSQWMRWY